MKCLLLTGCTGMLGQFLLRDRLLAGQPIAVIVRDRKHISAQERVDQIVVRLERQAQRYLPRPTVIVGDLLQPMLGVSADDLSWIERNCDSIVHAAASVKFHGEATDQSNPASEPYRSNVVGTQNVIELCQRTGVVHFHHVSTAYVSGEQSGRVLEQPIVGQRKFRNDYESSKSQAEELVRAASHFQSKTYLRPSIIVGDRYTGFAPAFHGIYTALHLGYLFLMASLRAGTTELTSELVEEVINSHFIEQLGLTGDELKNLVPVDWVSAVITHVVQHPELHGRIYHITNPHPVSLPELTSSMKQQVLEFLPQIQAMQGGAPSNLLNLDGFRSYMETYSAHFQTDPLFDSKNTQRYVPITCPQLDQDMLQRVWKYAIEVDFTPPRNGLPEHSQVGQLLQQLSLCSLSQETAHCTPKFHLHLHVNGPGGGAWKLAFERAGDNCLVSSVNRIEYSPDDFKNTMRVQTTSQVLSMIVNDGWSVDEAIYGGKLLITNGSTECTRSIECNGVAVLLRQFFAGLHGAGFHGAGSHGAGSHRGHSSPFLAGASEKVTGFGRSDHSLS